MWQVHIWQSNILKCKVKTSSKAMPVNTNIFNSLCKTKQCFIINTIAALSNFWWFSRFNRRCWYTTQHIYLQNLEKNLARYWLWHPWLTWIVWCSWISRTIMHMRSAPSKDTFEQKWVILWVFRYIVETE